MSNYVCKSQSTITKPSKSKVWIINPILNCCKINIPKKHVCHLLSSSNIRVNKDLSISSVYMLKHFNRLFYVTQEENISVFNKNIIIILPAFNKTVSSDVRRVHALPKIVKQRLTMWQVNRLRNGKYSSWIFFYARNDGYVFKYKEI